MRPTASSKRRALCRVRREPRQNGSPLATRSSSGTAAADVPNARIVHATVHSPAISAMFGADAADGSSCAEVGDRRPPAARLASLLHDVCDSLHRTYAVGDRVLSAVSSRRTCARRGRPPGPAICAGCRRAAPRFGRAGVGPASGRMGADRLLNADRDRSPVPDASAALHRLGPLPVLSRHQAGAVQAVISRRCGSPRIARCSPGAERIDAGRQVPRGHRPACGDAPFRRMDAPRRGAAGGDCPPYLPFQEGTALRSLPPRPGAERQAAHDLGADRRPRGHDLRAGRLSASR